MSDAIDKAAKQLLASIEKSQIKEKTPAAKTAGNNPKKRRISVRSDEASSSQTAKTTKPLSTQIFESRENFLGRLRWPD